MSFSETNARIALLDDGAIARNLPIAIARKRNASAVVLSLIAQYDARRLYLPNGFPSMLAYCMGALEFTEDGAKKRIQAARVAREFPLLFDALQDGRLHLSAIGLLGPRLTKENIEGLVAASAHRSKTEIRQLLSDSFSLLDTPICAAPASEAELRSFEGAPGHVVNLFTMSPSESMSPDSVTAAQHNKELAESESEASTVENAPDHVATDWKSAREARLFPLPKVGQTTHDKLTRLRDLLSHRIPSGDIERVLAYALDAGLQLANKRKYAATCAPRAPKQQSAHTRSIPASVRRAVRERDGDQCTHTSADGHRCPARGALEFDHIQPFALGGEATVDNIRTVCRAHNQYLAECTYGVEFMHAKRMRASA